MRKTLLLTLLLVSLLGFSLWLTHYNWVTSNQTSLQQTQTPDSFMLHAVYVRFNKDGRIHNQMIIPRMIHFQTGNVSDFNDPKMTVYGDKKVPWTITASYGQSQNGTEQVKLWGNVKIVQPKTQNKPPMIITTHSLIIFPKEEIAMTDQPIMLKQPNAVINSVGLQANFKTNKIELLSHAHAVYNLKD